MSRPYMRGPHEFFAVLYVRRESAWHGPRKQPSVLDATVLQARVTDSRRRA